MTAPKNPAAMKRELVRLADKPGVFISYNDGRPGHTRAIAEILEIEENFMIVQFDDRASTTTIFFSDEKWLNHIVFHVSREAIDRYQDPLNEN